MLTSVVFLYKSRTKREDMSFGKFFRSRLVEKWVDESYRIRETRVKIKNVKLKKTVWWDANSPLTKEMLEQGWEYGQYLNEE